MKYYQHKENGELVGITGSWRELVTDDSTNVITEAVFPYRWLGGGIVGHCISFKELSKNYKRINKNRAKELCSDFGQWRHNNTELNWGVVSNGRASLEELIPTRKSGFGRSYTDEQKKEQNEYIKRLPEKLQADYSDFANRESLAPYDVEHIYWAQGSKLMKLLELI